VIINNRYFDDDSQFREGAEIDAANLKNLFASFHFEVVSFEDKTAEVFTQFFVLFCEKLLSVVSNSVSIS